MAARHDNKDVINVEKHSAVFWCSGEEEAGQQEVGQHRDTINVYDNAAMLAETAKARHVEEVELQHSVQCTGEL